ncbi:MAG: phosphoserine phosphatase SerB [Rhodomicrobiaceae bacterium]
MSQTKTAAILTIIAPEGQALLNDKALSNIKDKLEIESEPQWLAFGEAVDLELDVQWKQTEDQNNIKTKISDLLQGHPFDFALQPSEHRRKKLLISDMDSTIISEECIDEIAHMAGIKPKIAAITERAMQGEIEFDAALRERVGLLKGLDTKALDTVISERLNLNKGARTLVQTMAANDAYCALVSGGFTFFTEKIAKLTGFHTTQANTLEIEDDKLTGNVIPPILGSAAKKQALEQFINEQKSSPENTLAVGDGANDLEMIKASGLGVAYYAKPIVAAEADASVNHTDLTALLYMQGYKKSDFVTD